MKNNILYIIILLTTISFTSCKKDTPNPEVDQEEVSSARLVFTEVEAVVNGNTTVYNELEHPEQDSISFSGTDFLPPVGAHLHLEVGKTYRFNLKVFDFAGRQSQQTFIDRDDQHYAFILGADAGNIKVVYQDKKSADKTVQVGVTGYITVLKVQNTFTMRYVLRHLNPGVKANINTATDMLNPNFTQFGGANDLDLKFEMHFVEEDHSHHDH